MFRICAGIGAIFAIVVGLFNPGPAKAHFVRLKFTSRDETPEIELPSLDTADIKYQVYKETWDDPYNRFIVESLNVHFGLLTSAQFQTLADRFKPGHDIVFQPTRDYWLTDFLPPVMQSLLGTTYQPKILERDLLLSSGTQKEVHIETAANCWSTVHCLLASNQNEYRTQYIEDEPMRDLLLNKAYADHKESTFVSVGGRYTDAVPTFLRRNAVQPGDYVVVMDPSRNYELKHVALHLFDGLFFEKSGKFPRNGYRISRLANFKLDSSVSMYVMRPHSPFPPIRTLFSLEAEPVEKRSTTIENIRRWPRIDSSSFVYMHRTLDSLNGPPGWLSLSLTAQVVYDPKTGKYTLEEQAFEADFEDQQLELSWPEDACLRRFLKTPIAQ